MDLTDPEIKKRKRNRSMKWNSMRVCESTSLRHWFVGGAYTFNATLYTVLACHKLALLKASGAVLSAVLLSFKSVVLKRLWKLYGPRWNCVY